MVFIPGSGVLLLEFSVDASYFVSYYLLAFEKDFEV